jgi:hypothetical protein
MDQVSFGRLGGNVKALSAALGVGVLITMGALTLTYPSSSVGTSSDTWKADTRITVTPSPVPPSVAPTHKASYCDNNSPHSGFDGCPSAWQAK